MNTNNQTDAIINPNCRDYETVYLGNWGIFKNGQLVCIRPNKQDALAWIEKQADDMDARRNWRLPK